MFSAADILPLKELLSASSKFTIVTHKNPDGDALGSSLGLWHVLNRMGKDPTVITPNDYPEFLAWMPGEERVVRYNEEPQRADQIIQDAEILFILDLNQLPRLDGLQDIVANAGCTKVLVDHHQEPDEIADLMLSRPGASSTSEMIYNLIDALGATEYLTQEGAECLYTGIMTDTGSFRFSSTTASTHAAAAAMMKLGVEPSEIFQKVENSSSLGRLQLLGYTLSNKLEVFEEYNTCIMSLSEEELERHHFQKGDTEGLVNYGLSIRGMRMSVLFIQQDGIIKMSFRSVGDVPVNKMAKTHFHGGGHINAAGGIFYGKMEDALQRFSDVLPEFKNDLIA